MKEDNYSRSNSSAQSKNKFNYPTDDSLDFINEGQFNNSFQDIGNNNKAFTLISSFGNLNMNIE